jgi:hypothetical protein
MEVPRQLFTEPLMQPLIHQTRHAVRFITQPAVQILAGLMLLAVAFTSPGLPACTGMALVALGATAATVERLQSSPARGPLLYAHLLIYTSIYLLFVGAALDAAVRTGVPLSGLATLDVAASLAIVVIAGRDAIRAILAPLSTEY